MPRLRPLVALLLGLASPAPLLVAVPATTTPPQAPGVPLAPPAELASFAADWCVECHDAGDKKGGLDLESLPFSADPAAHAKWVRIYDRVLAGEMPPPDRKTRPAAVELKGFLDILGRELDAQHRSTRGTALRRLNRAEYENTLDDLLGVRLSLGQVLPDDPVSHGFDNLGHELGLSDAQLALYLQIAGQAVDEVLALGKQPRTTKLSTGLARPAAEESTAAAGDRRERAWLARDDGAVVVFSNGNLPGAYLERFRAPVAGRYRVRLTAAAHQSERPVVFSLRAIPANGGLGNTYGRGVGLFEVGARPETFEFEAALQAGDRLRFLVDLTPDSTALRAQGPAAYAGPGLAVFPAEIEGPLYSAWPPRGQALLFGDLLPDARAGQGGKGPLSVDSSEPARDAARLLRGLADAAFRRPVYEDDLAPYLALFEAERAAGAPFTAALRTAAIALLCSPDFLYLVERPGRLDDHALATRLAYFLWRGPPDDELRRLADEGRLHAPATLRAQTERLLADNRAARFVRDFTDAWLNLREIEFTTPDERLYPEFDLFLQDSMLGETRSFFAELLRADLDPVNIVRSDFAMLNSRLASHYGIDGVEGMAIRRVPLPPDSRRGGVLTQAAVLKVSANGVATSPVTRGVFVLERILGVAPPPPPPGVPGLEPDIRGATTLRAQLEKHRAAPQCHGCHTLIDPPGFALENFDPVGGWRERYRSLGAGDKIDQRARGRPVAYRLAQPVDASAELRDGARFADFAGFQALLLRDSLRVRRTVLEKLLTFGTGREPGFSDRAETDRLARELSARGAGLREFVHAAVQSEIFHTK